MKSEEPGGYKKVGEKTERKGKVEGGKVQGTWRGGTGKKEREDSNNTRLTDYPNLGKPVPEK